VSEVVLRTRGLVKRFGSLTAVDHLDLEVGRGEVVRLLGPNGAGKSTTIGMILGLVRPTEGTAEVMGRDVCHDPQNALAGSGAIVETPAFYPYLTGPRRSAPRPRRPQRSGEVQVTARTRWDEAASAPPPSSPIPRRRRWCSWPTRCCSSA
jgi:energy-coupling factor transporter ATP-binding protein EcfA2